MFGQKSLRQFIAVAEELNFRRAAQRLHMTQPPLTQGIQRLEAQLGLQLFDRSQPRVRLTAAGAALLDEARVLLSQTEKAIETARRAERGLTSLLRVSFVPSVGQHLLPDIVLAFRRDHPAAHLELTAQTSSQQLEGLRRGTVDVAIIVSPARVSSS
jgi:DNA-binding transcriptional LysR family regulator